MIDAIDCHAHVIDPVRFPFVPGKGYQPRADESGPREAYWSTLSSHGVSHGLLVQPSSYAYDNRAMLDAMALASGRAKGIAVVEDDPHDDTLDALTAAGCIGVRLNLGSFDPGFFGRSTAIPFLRRMRERKLLVQVYTHARQWADIAPVLADTGVSVIVDHMGEPSIDEGLGQRGFAEVLTLGRSGRAIVKLSAAYRMSRQPAPYRDVAPYAQACIEAFGIDRCVWGSDWPFLNAGRPTSYADQLAWLECVVPDADMRRRILVDNPRKLFGFA